LWGHGHTPDRCGPFSLRSFSADVAELIENVAGGPTHVVGHSIGANVGLDLVLRRPELVRSLVQASRGFRFEGEIAPGGASPDELVAQTDAFMGDRYAAVSPDGRDHYPVVLRKDFDLNTREPNFTAVEVASITTRTLILGSDDD